MNARTSLRQKDPEKPFRPGAAKSGKASLPHRNPLCEVPRKRRRSQKAEPLNARKLAKKQHLVWLDSQEQDRLLRQRSLSEAKQGNYTDAIEGLTVLIDRNPLNATDYNNRGLVHFQCGQLNAALDDFNHAIELNPKLASAYNNRANYYAAQGQFVEAIVDYETAIDLDPTNVRAWINQGITFRDLEMNSQAIENFDHALQMSQLLARGPEDTNFLEAHIYGSRGRTHHLAGDWNYAIADYYRALDRIPPFETANPLHRLQVQIGTWLKELQI